MTDDEERATVGEPTDEPEHRQGPPDGEPAEVAPPIDRAAGPPPPGFARRWGNLIATGLLAVLAVLAVVWVVGRGDPVALEVDGRPIADAEAVVAEAEAAFDRLVEADGAHPPDGAGCWFAPAGERPGRSRGEAEPRVACGPVRLGVTTGDRVWVVGDVRYQTRAVGGGQEVTGRFGGLDGVEALEAGDLVRPDGAEPPDAADLRPPDPGLRNRDGQRLLGDREVLAEVERSLGPAAERSRAALADDAACWFGIVPDPAAPAPVTGTAAAGARISDGALWCGPVLLLTSSTGEVWTRVNLTSQRDELFALARVRAGTLSGISATQALPAGTQLHRPDGRPPPERIELEPPDARPQARGHVEVLTDVPADLELTDPAGEGRLVTPGRSLTIEGVGRLPKVGAGRTAVVAADGEELVVARFRRVDAERSGAGRGTAQLVVGTGRQAFTGWARLPEQGLLVVSAPRGAEVALEVLHDGVAQSISLTTGRLGSGARAPLYRDTAEVGVGRPMEVAVVLPGGPPASAGGVVASVGVEAWRERLGWAPAGRAFLTVTLQDWTVTRPCCAVSRVEVVPRWTVVLPDGTETPSRDLPAGVGGDLVVFEVPETVTAAELRLVAMATFEQGGAPGSAVGGPATLAVEVPA